MSNFYHSLYALLCKRYRPYVTFCNHQLSSCPKSKCLRIFFVALGLLLANIITINASSTDRSKIYTIDIRNEIGPTTQLYLKNGLSEAEQLKADAILIRLNTYGGILESADSMRTAILYSPIPVYVFIDNNAASAGALLSIACKKIYMRRGANIGAATVVDQSGSAMPDKYQSYMRSIMRSTAEAHGKDTLIQKGDTVLRWKRDPLIAEAMVDDRVVIPQLVDSGKVLTFTAEEAMKWGYCDGLAETIDEVITEYLGIKDYELNSYSPTWADKAKGFLLNPALQALLIMLIIGGIYFEMQSPGLGFPSLVALAAAILYFAPLYLDGLAQYWEIGLFIVGLLLLIIEIFVLPGIGLAGVSGVILIIGSLTIGLLDNDGFKFEAVNGDAISRASITVLTGLIASISLAFWLSHKIGQRGAWRKMALTSDLEEAVSSPTHQELVGQIGQAATVLRLSGKVEINGELYDALSESGFIEKGETIQVVRSSQGQLYVVSIR